MTLKRKDGLISLSKISLWFGILASIAMCVEALPTGISYMKTVVAPWTSLPQAVQGHSAILISIRNDLDEIKDRMGIPVGRYDPLMLTNKTVVKNERNQ
jgi:hypothetical protein